MIQGRLVLLQQEQSSLDHWHGAQVNAKADRLIELGGTKLRVSDEEVEDHYHIAMQDPEGNEFCLR